MCAELNVIKTQSRLKGNISKWFFQGFTIHYTATVRLSTYYVHRIRIYKVPILPPILDLTFLLQLDQDNFYWAFSIYLLCKKEGLFIRRPRASRDVQTTQKMCLTTTVFETIAILCLSVPHPMADRWLVTVLNFKT